MGDVLSGKSGGKCQKISAAHLQQACLFPMHGLPPPWGSNGCRCPPQEAGEKA